MNVQATQTAGVVYIVRNANGSNEAVFRSPGGQRWRRGLGGVGEAFAFLTGEMHISFRDAYRIVHGNLGMAIPVSQMRNGFGTPELVRSR
ncbi:MAG TPA: hypothetical protein VN709_02750 [Terriglobales bacterium]|nr:hypothetical protein [Terriglobales bacterium]